MSKLTRVSDNILAKCPKCDHSFNVYESNFSTIVRTPRDIYNAFMYLAPLDHEELHIAVMNTKNKILSRHLIYQGNISASLVRVAEVLREPVRENASGFVLVHNHPSGDPTPSPDDLHLTAEVLAAARIFDIDLLDHVIVAGTEYVSLRDRGVCFDRKIPGVA